MPAATVAELLDFETQFDTALESVLASASAPSTYQLCGATTTALLTTPRLEYELNVGGDAGPSGTTLVRAEPRDQAAYVGTLTFRFIYDHTKLSAAAAGLIRGHVRERLSPSAAALDATLLPWIEITHLTETGSARGRFKDEQEKLLSEWVTTWSVGWYIRETAWPA